jgi:hypothetical protein
MHQLPKLGVSQFPEPQMEHITEGAFVIAGIGEHQQAISGTVFIRGLRHAQFELARRVLPEINPVDQLVMRRCTGAFDRQHEHFAQPKHEAGTSHFSPFLPI